MTRSNSVPRMSPGRIAFSSGGVVCLLVLALAGSSVLGSDLSPGVTVTVQESSPARVVLQYAVGDYAGQPVTIEGKEYTLVTLGKEAPMLVTGAPELPHVCRSIIIPDDAEMSLAVTGAEYQDIEGVDVAPSKGNLPRTVNPEDVPYTFGTWYAVDAFYPGEVATLGEPYILRDYRGVVVDLKPFQYNPVKRTLRVYKSVTVEVSNVGRSDVNVLDRLTRSGELSLAFHNLYQVHFLNYNPGPRYAPLDEVGGMLIICYDSWLPNVAPLVSHKNSIGISTTAVGVSTIPGGNTATAIRSYIQSQYSGGNLAFVLLVGDAAQVATPSTTYSGSTGSSDPTYSTVGGTDNYPDIMVGRFSAETSAQVDTQVQRTIEYETMPATLQTWFWKGTGIGSEYGTGDDGEYDYQHIANIRTLLLGHGYTQVDELYGTTGATAAQVSAALNAGRGIINYCGHGSATSWGTTGFSNSNVAALTNDNMLPFIFSVACLNGQFSGSTCFAEAWLRSTHNGEPIGAVGTYMSSINQDWNPPMEAQDVFNALYTATTPSYNCYGTLCYAGSCGMMDNYGASTGSAGAGMFLTWHVFGDPSLRVIGEVEVNGLAVTPAEGLSSSGGMGGPFSPGSKVYTLQNQDSSSINYTVSKTAAWVTLSSTSGTLSAGGSTTVTVSINSSADSLSAGSYNDTVTFTNTTDHLGDTTRPVTLQVLPALAVTPADGLTSSGGFGGPFSPGSKQYTLQNQGGSSINYTVSKMADWVTLSSTGGTLTGGGSTTITVSINSGAGSLVAGSYSDTVSFINTTNHSGDTTRPVTLQVLPALAVTPADGLTSSGSIGGPFSPSSKVYTLQNQGASSINYTVSKTADWLTLSSTGGTLSGGGTTNITVSINSAAGSLAVGSYSDTVSFVNTTNHSGDTTRPVSLTVNPVSNDVCANAYVVCPGTYTGTTAGMTLDGSATCDGSSPGPDVWYKYTPGSSGSAMISLCSSSTQWDSVLSVRTGTCPGTTEVSCVDDTCGGTATHGTLTVSVTGGTMYLIRVGGYASTNSGPFTLTISGPACGSSDTTPPAPNPMTFVSAPVPASTNSISMTASTATDTTSPPVSYYFHFVSGGTGGSDSAWQSGTTYTDTGLTANTSYSYQVKARDSASTPNETAYSTPASTTATLIETPTGVSFGTVTANSIVLNAGGTFTNLTTGSSGLYFDSTTTGGDGGINAWVQATTDTATGLNPNTSYTFQVKARNQSSVDTAYSPTAAKVTLANVPTAPTLSGATRTTLNLDVNANGNPAATEFAVMCTASSPTDSNWNGKYVNASGAASATAVWRTEAQWGVTTVQALQACTTYTFAVKARNSESVETVFGPGASLGTTGHLGDMDGDGAVAGDDIQSFITCAISGGSGCACANMTISAFVNCLLHPGTCP